MPAPLTKAWRRARRDIWLLRFAAFVISIMLWLTVLGGKRVEINKTITLDYQLPKSLVISNQAPKEVSFRVVGPRAFMKEYEERDIVIGIDLTNANPGDYEVPISEERLDVPLGLRVISVSQSTIPLKLEHALPKTVPIRAVFSGQLPDGIKVVSVTLRPSTVEIRGAPSRLQSIDAVPTEDISPSPNALRQEFDVKLSMKDMPGIVVENPNQFVHVVAELAGSLSRKWFRDISVGLKVGSGRNAKSVDATGLGIRMKPEKISFLLEGPDVIMSKLKPADIEAWAEIQTLKGGTYKSRLNWRLAPELRVVKRTSDWVDVVVPPLK